MNEAPRRTATIPSHGPKQRRLTRERVKRLHGQLPCAVLGPVTGALGTFDAEARLSTDDFHRIFRTVEASMTTRSAKSATAAEEIAAIEDLVSDLEKRLRRLTDLSSEARSEVSGATGDVKDFVNDALSDIMQRVRESAATMGQSVAQEASRVGGDALKKVTDEVEQRPLVMLAVAAGIGFLVGLANRR
jgi:ElaB/YqjD/DUF883 family membrane-anchored ribosome-binding protein